MNQIRLHTAEQGRKNQNHMAEWEIGFLSKCWKLRMQKKNVYSQLWDYGVNEDTKAKVKELEKKLGEHLDDSNVILQGENDVDLKMLEELDDEGIGTMVEDGITPTEEEYDDMIVEEHPKADDKEALD
jgi:hypothetical protein